MDGSFQFSVDPEGIATVVFDLAGEKVNKLSQRTLEELEALLDQAAGNKQIKALCIISGKEGNFIAGADLNSFEPIFKEPSLAAGMIDTGHRVFDKLQNLPFPTFALIQGACLGGGTELALACTYRVVADYPKTLIGLPEVTLGIFPGWGGSQRLPRLVGLMEALPLLLTGKSINARKALKIHLADAIAAPEFLREKARAFIKYCLTQDGRKAVAQKRRLHGLKHLLFEKNPLGRSFVYHKTKKQILKKSKGHYPAPLILLNLVKESYTLPLKEGLAKEMRTFKQNLTTGFAIAPHLIHLFFVQEALKKEPFTRAQVPAAVTAAGILGAGTMGSSIAWLFSNKELPVRMKDINWNAVGHGVHAIHDIYAKMVKDKRLSASEAALKFHQVSGTVDYSGFKHLNFVVEAAVESLELKHQLLRELENQLSPEAVIATNTSSLTLADMGAVMVHPQRLVGMHFFNPANRMPLVEVAMGEKTSPQAVATAVDLARKLGKTAIVVRDCPGFLVNRIFIPAANETMRLFEEGVARSRIEKSMLQFGMPLSPFLLADEVGNDVGYKVSKVFEQAYGPRMAAPKILELLYAQKLYGKKTGQGFYLHSYLQDGKKSRPNPKAEELRASLHHKTITISDRDLRDRVILSMVNEAARCLQEKVIENRDYLDMALILGIGFPPFRGGLLRYADTLGIAYIVEQLTRFQQEYGERFAPAPLLLEMQRTHSSFF
jgi:3-hydroxyacyl-CoA dehydrogenase / enoyl-CoA hydratase / 3-hydroxybutyryl-CoA epimerase